jgi:hypothetical protein
MLQALIQLQSQWLQFSSFSPLLLSSLPSFSKVYHTFLSKIIYLYKFIIFIIQWFINQLFILLAANGECSLSDIKIRHYITHDYAHGMPVWKLNITNNCVCTQSQVKLNCTGFQTYFEDDPAILNAHENECLVKKGAPIHSHESLIFRYAWEPKFTFHPISSKSQCS